MAAITEKKSFIWLHLLVIFTGVIILVRSVAANSCPSGTVILWSGETTKLTCIMGRAQESGWCNRKMLDWIDKRPPGMNIIYGGGHTYLPFDRIRRIQIAKKRHMDNEYFAECHIELRDGKDISAYCAVYGRYYGAYLCGINDLGTVSSVPTSQIREIIID